MKNRISRFAQLLLVSFISTFIYPSVRGTSSFVVTNSADALSPGTLRQAIADANAIGGSEISFATNIIGVLSLTNGELVLATNVNIIGPGADKLAISAGGGGRIFNIKAGSTVAISGLTTSDGRGWSSTVPDRYSYGAGIYNLGTLTLASCVISNNHIFTQTFYLIPGASGGGIYNLGTLAMSNCLVCSNSSAPGGVDWAGHPGGDGGGLYNAGVLRMTDCTVSDNNTGRGGDAIEYGYGGAGGSGGGIFNSGSLALVRCTLNGNFCGNGGNGDDGAIYYGGWGGDGGAGGSGGAIFGSCSLTNCTIVGNSAGAGGGAGNGASGINSGESGGNGGTGGRGGSGGGICGSATVVSCTIAGNSAKAAGPGGGGGVGGSLGTNGIAGSNGAPGTGGGVSGGATLLSSIVANNTAPGSGPDVIGNITSLGHNLVGNSSGNSIFPGNGNLLDIDPLLGLLTNNGGLTYTLALLPGSPAIDHGSSAGLATDQRGMTRPYDVVGVPNAVDGSDIGAFEFVSASPASVLAWGFNGDGQAQVRADATQVKAIAAGTYHSLALRADGSVIGWGRGDFGETIAPLDLNDATAIAGGWGFSLAVKTNRTVSSWGWSRVGTSYFPADLSNVVAVAAGWDHALALRNDGTVRVWGSIAHDQQMVPTNLFGVTAISGGGFHSLALKRDGTVSAWGDDGQAQTNVPAGLTNIATVAAGASHNLALKWDGTVTAWGDNSSGQTDLPVGLTNVVAIAAGGAHSLALKQDGSMIGWGANDFGQATAPANASNVIAIAAGAQHSLALLGDGSPQITVQPFDQYVLPGETIQIGAMAVGLGPLNWRWYRNNQPLTNNLFLSGAGAALLVISNFSACDAGDYFVQVTNGFGSTLSATALVDLKRIWFADVRCDSSKKMVLTIGGMPGDVCRLQISTDLFEWQDQCSITNLTGTIEFKEATSASDPQRFYRLSMP